MYQVVNVFLRAVGLWGLTGFANVLPDPGVFRYQLLPAGSPFASASNFVFVHKLVCSKSLEVPQLNKTYFSRRVTDEITMFSFRNKALTGMHSTDNCIIQGLFDRPSSLQGLCCSRSV